MQLDWENIGFQYRKTPFNVRCSYKNGKWWDLEIYESDQISLPIASTCLHYGQAVFEWLKAFRGKDNKIRIFRPDENALRMQKSAQRIIMQVPDEKLFVDAVSLAVSKNQEFVPPYGTGASLYIRPLLIGSSAVIGPSPADEYTFLVFVLPVGPYYKSGLQTIKSVVVYDYDRAAPLWVGWYKVAWNYASGLIASKMAKSMWYDIEIYLDSKTKQYIDECWSSNFFMIKDQTYITPKSDSILDSITNKSLQVIAKDLWLNVEKRPILLEDLASGDEAWACWTAACISPISSVFDPKNSNNYFFGDSVWYRTQKLYTNLLWIQNWDLEDLYSWNLTL